MSEKTTIDKRLKGEGKPTLKVGAYTPEGEGFPILVPILYVPFTGNNLFAGTVYRREEPMYDWLKAACDGKPVWLYGETPKPL